MITDTHDTQATPAAADEQLWRDAWYIAWIGAANPAAVASTLARHTATMTHALGTREACRHLALRAIAGHLAYLYGYGLGPDDDALSAVREHAASLGLDVSS